jgi:hypothetical protein
MEEVVRQYNELITEMLAHKEAAEQTAAAECAEQYPDREMVKIMETFHQQELSGARIVTDKEIVFEYDQEKGEAVAPRPGNERVCFSLLF